jgi:signal transduction histidine kinase
MTADTKGRRRRQPWRSLRVRITLAATTAFIVVFAIASAALIQRVNSSLEDDLVTASQQAINCAAPQLASGVDPQTAVRQTCQAGVPLEIRDAAGNVVVGSPNAGGVVGSGPAQIGTAPEAGLAAPPGDFLSVQGQTQTPRGEFTIVARQPLDNVRRTIDTLRNLLFLLVPLVAAGVAAIVWVVVDRALRPVEKLRNEVDQINHSTISRRLTEPGSATEIDMLARTMNEMFDRLETSSTQQRQFVSDAGHELKTPLATLRTTVEVAQRQPDPDWSAVSERVLASERRLEALVDDLLTLARFDEDTRAPDADRRPVDLEELVLDWRSTTNVDGRLDVDVTKVGAARVSGDERELHRLVGNILDNAAQHAAARISVSLQASTTGVVLTVDDDGPGVPSEQRKVIFDRFARVGQARDRLAISTAPDAGTGLGLAIAHACAVRHGGSIRVEDSALGGARFVVRLPVGSMPGPGGGADV